MSLCSHQGHSFFVLVEVRVLTMDWTLLYHSSMSLHALETLEVLVLVPRITLALRVARWSHMMWKFMRFNLWVANNWAKRRNCWLTDLATSVGVLSKFMVAEILRDYHFLLFLVGTNLGSLWSLWLVHDRHFEFVSIVYWVEIIFMLTLKRPDHLKLWSIHINFVSM